LLRATGSPRQNRPMFTDRRVLAGFWSMFAAIAIIAVAASL
jgi:hypothetical protein